MTEKISDERLAQILDSDIGIGTSEQVGALIWKLAREVSEYRKREAEQVYEYGVRYGDDHMVRRFSSRERAESHLAPTFGDKLIRRVVARSVPAGEWVEVIDGD